MHKKTIITRSKFTVHGDILIDDKPLIKHENEATWEHVLYDRSYNSSIQGKRRLNWSNYKEVLDI